MISKRSSFVCITLSVFCFVQCFGLEKRTPLYISYIASINPKVGFPSGGSIPAFQIALDIINNRTDILANYSLQHTDVLDSKCEYTTALDRFFQHFEENVTYIATVCCGCSVSTIPVAEISHYWNIPQISHSAALTLNDGTRFRNFFRLLPTNRNLPFGIVRTARQFGWKKLLVISQNEGLFTTLTNALHLLYTAHNWIIDTSILINSDVNSFPIESIFRKIENEHYRIIMINTYSQFAYKIFCEAFHRKLIAPKFIWMTNLWYNTRWWSSFTSPCTSEQIEVALEGSIGVIPDGYVPREGNLPTSFGMTYCQFLDEYLERIDKFRINNASVAPISLPNIPFDMAWALGLGLDAAVERITMMNDTGCEHLSGEMVPLEEFDYSNDKMGCILKQSMGSVEFEGFSGSIRFNENGSQPDTLLVVQQYSKLEIGLVERTTVAKIDIAMDSFTNINTTQEIWEELPYDGFPEETIEQYNIALFVIYITISIAGLVFAIVCLIFNIVFRNKKVLKLSSPNLNYLIICGSIILYLSVFVFTYMPPNVGKLIPATVICNLRIWLFSLGYTMCFAVILSKTWRVYYIFNNPLPKKKVIKDWMLLVIIAVVIFVDLTILLIGTILNASRLEASEIRSIINPTEVKDKLIKINYIYVCLRKGSGPIIWLSISFAYKGILQVIGMFMAFHIRKVKIKALNDSKQTAIIIYVNTIILITLTTAAFALDDYHNGHAAIFGLALIIDATLFLGALFVPKMVRLYHDPKELKVLPEQNFSQNTLRTWQANGENQKKEVDSVSGLQKEVEELKQIIKEANIKIPEKY